MGESVRPAPGTKAVEPDSGAGHEFVTLFGGGLLHTPARSPTRSAAALEAAKRYYAEIMRPFRQPVRRNLDKVRTRDIRIIAPSHGPAYDEPQIIFDAYRDWASDAVCNEVVLPYVTMHHSTQRLVDALVDALVA